MSNVPLCSQCCTSVSVGDKAPGTRHRLLTGQPHSHIHGRPQVGAVVGSSGRGGGGNATSYIIHSRKESTAPRRRGNLVADDSVFHCHMPLCFLSPRPTNPSLTNLSPSPTNPSLSSTHRCYLSHVHIHIYIFFYTYTHIHTYALYFLRKDIMIR
jgi:hypothetical protein